VSKLTDFINASKRAEDLKPEPFRYTDEEGAKLIGVRVTDWGDIQFLDQLEYLSPKDALRLRDWLTDLLDGGGGNAREEPT
jgi:hypothetical protein